MFTLFLKDVYSRLSPLSCHQRKMV